MDRPGFDRRRRGAARLSLYGSFAVIGLIGLALYPLLRHSIRLALAQEWANVDYAAIGSVQLLQQLIRIDTTPGSGGEVAAAEFLAAELERAGIASQIERFGDGRANLWGVLEGDDRRAVVLHSHLDTDPITEGERWRDSPFSGRLEPPWIYGRGAFDMKSVTIAQLRAIVTLAREAQASGRRLRRSVILLATSSEETGSDLGTRWILAERPDLVGRFWAILSEGGVLEAIDPHTIKYWGTEVGQKRFVQVTVCSPRRERLDELLADLQHQGQPLTGRRLVPDVANFLERYGGSRGSQLHVGLLADPAALIDDLSRFLSLPSFLRALLRDEIHSFPIEPDPETGGYRLRLVLHLLPGGDVEESRRLLLPEWMTFGLAVRVRDPDTAEAASPLDHPAYLALDQLLGERYRGTERGPYYLSFYANDCRFFRRRDLPCYGFTPFVFVTTDSFTMSGPNERIALPAFVDGVELYVEAVRRIVGTDGN